MIDEILETRQKKHTKHLNIVPILDMLTTVIFFLLMSTSFIEYTKLTLPPAATVATVMTSSAPPLAPKLKISADVSGDYSVKLEWGGTAPGQRTENVKESDVESAVRKLTQAFSVEHKQERTLQISMGRSVKYQVLISSMDGARSFLPDVVLASYE